jgi:hypothetical protein
MPASGASKAQGLPRHPSSVLRTAVFQAAVILALGGGFGNRIAWARSDAMPVVANLGQMRGAEPLMVPAASSILHDASAPTVLEVADGNWRGVALPAGGSLTEKTALFNALVWPARQRPSTRAKNWYYWAACVTWALANRCVDKILPMSTNTLKAYTYDLIGFGSSVSVITACWNAVQDRHSDAQMQPPIFGQGEYSRWQKCISHIMGTPFSLKLPIHKSLVHSLLSWRPGHPGQHRDRLIVCLMTIACMRVGEIARLQVCDLWFDFFVAMGIPGMLGTAAIHVLNRKNDGARKGHHPALGRSTDPQLDIVFQLQTWLASMGLSVHPGCTKRANTAARCPKCRPLFPRLANGPGRVHVATDEPMSVNMITEAVKQMVTREGLDSTLFSGISCRKGGLTTAILAGVPEEILYLQSGHGSNRPGRNYMILRNNPTRLLETFAAFDL